MDLDVIGVGLSHSIPFGGGYPPALHLKKHSLADPLLMRTQSLPAE